MTARNDFVFLFDCDNTLLGNFRMKEDLRRRLDREIGIDAQNR